MRRMRHIYREKKRAEDEATPSSETGPTEARHVSRALNVSWLEESSKLSSRFFGPKKVIRQTPQPVSLKRRDYGVGGN